MADPRRKPANDRAGLTAKNACGEFEFYVTVNFYDDNPPTVPCEVFIHISKVGSTVAGFCDALCRSLSVAFQYSIPWEILRNQMLGAKFDPSGSSLDGKHHYPSLVHGIAETIDSCIRKQQEVWRDND